MSPRAATRQKELSWNILGDSLCKNLIPISLLPRGFPTPRSVLQKGKRFSCLIRRLYRRVPLPQENLFYLFRNMMTVDEPRKRAISWNSTVPLPWKSASKAERVIMTRLLLLLILVLILLRLLLIIKLLLLLLESRTSHHDTTATTTNTSTNTTTTTSDDKTTTTTTRKPH